MLKKDAEALNNVRKGSQFPDSQRGCHVFKLLKHEDYDGRTKDESKGEPSKWERSKGALSKGEPSKGALSEGEPSEGAPSKRKVRKRKKKKKSERDAENEEVFEYHKMLLLNEDLPSKDTQFNYNDLKKSKENVVEEPEPVQETPVEEEPVQVPEPEPEPLPEPPPPITEDEEIDMTELYAQDKFRDELRRIDIVLVAVDDGEFEVTEERNRYLQSILKAGLHMETSPGVMMINRNLIFIKIHAPDSVLDEYNHAFGTKKYFRDDHLRFVQPGLTFHGLLLRRTRINHERELISIVRDQYEEPLRLSNAERSLIVYKILLQLPFGSNANNFGLDRLLSRRILLDAFALHDGPHFIFPNQDWKTISARQFLFYNWVGKINAYKVHPLNLIREYFGERIGMYFAFYEFFNHALMIATIFGLILYYLALNDTTDDSIVDDVCNRKNKKHTHMCPRCNNFEACRFINMTDLCKLAKIHKVLDSPKTLYYAIFLAVWAPAFYVLWRRKESFWIWLWEINTDRNKEIYKPEYIFDNEDRPHSTHTGLLQNYVRGPEKEVRTFLLVMLLIVLFGVPMLMLVPLFMHKQNTDIKLIKDKVVSLDNEEIAFVVIFAIKLVGVQILGELIYRAPIYYVTKYLENHLTYDSQARSFMFKTFLASFLWTFPIMFYYAWVKGVDFYTPVLPENNDILRQWVFVHGRFSFTHCGPFTCLDEVFFVLLTTLLIRHITIPFLLFLKGLIYDTWTDYNQGVRVTETVPSWEREYMLEPVTEAMMARKYTVLMMQFALVTLVGAVFPLAPLLILIRNYCDIRYEARKFVQRRRRPLLLGTGLGVWTPVLQRLAFFSVPAIAFTLARTTKTAARNTYMSRNGNMTGFFLYFLQLVDVKMYIEVAHYLMMPDMAVHLETYKKNKNFVPIKCHFPGLFKDYKDPKYGDPPPIYMPPHNLAKKYEFYLLRLNTNNLYLEFSMVGLMTALILNYAVPPYSSQLSNIMELEMRIKNAYIRKSNK